MSFKQFKALTFDMVGTIIDFERGVLEAVRAIGGRKAMELSDEAIFEPYKRGRDIFHQRSSEVMADVYLHLAMELDLPASREAADAFQLSVLRWPAFDDSAEALMRLRRHFRLIAMTNADRTAFSAYAHALGNPFDDSVTSDDTGCSKPDPQFFAFNRGRQSAFGIKFADILHVAQSQHHDIGVATKLGLQTCWIERRQDMPGFGGSPAVAELTKPTYHFATLKALADAVDAED